MTTTKPGTAAAQLSELRRIRAEMREMAQEVADRNAPVPRRLVPVTGTTPAVDLSVGDLAVLDRKALGRRSLLRLADELALRGAAGLIVSRETIAPLPTELRGAIEERIPLLVVDSDWGRARSWLLETEPAASNMQPDAVLRAVLRGFGRSGPLPGRLDPSRPLRATVVVAQSDGPSRLTLPEVEEIAANEAHLADPRSYVIGVEGVVAILSNSYDKLSSDAESIGRAVLDRTTVTPSTTRMMIGVGRAYPGIDGIRRTYREAKWAATVGEMLWGANRVVSFRDLGIYGLLEPFVADPSTSDTQDVEKLLEYDARNQTALLPTVETYFDAGRSGEAAASLFVHRNTISYRLRVVRRVTGLDVVRDPEARLLLEVQIRLARLWGILPAAPAHRVTSRTRRTPPMAGAVETPQI